MPLGRALALALIPGVAIALGLHFAVLGLRPHLLTLLGEPRLLFKLCLTFLLVALSGPLVLRLVRPGAGVRRAALMLAIVPAWRPPTWRSSSLFRQPNGAKGLWAPMRYSA